MISASERFERGCIVKESFYSVPQNDRSPGFVDLSFSFVGLCKRGERREQRRSARGRESRESTKRGREDLQDEDESRAEGGHRAR